MEQIIHGDCLEVLKGLPDESVHCCVTSPPYFGLRDYGVDGQLGLEKTPEEYVEKMVEVFRCGYRSEEIKEILKETIKQTLGIHSFQSVATTNQ
jgi:DNA modification methylase